GKHRQLGGKSRCVSDRHVVEIRGAADFCNGVASGCRVSSDRWSALLLTADLSRLAARVRNVPLPDTCTAAKHQGGPFPWPVSCTCLSSALFTNSTESIAAPSRVRNCSTASFIDGGRSPQ